MTLNEKVLIGFAAFFALLGFLQNAALVGTIHLAKEILDELKRSSHE